MTAERAFDRYLTRYPLVAVAGYALLVTVLLFLTWTSLAEIFERRAAVAAASDMLDQIEGRRRTTPAGDAASSTGPVPTGSPFVDGQTITVAGATLLQTVAAAVTKFGGNVLSSQVELQGSQSKEGFLSLIAICEIDQPALQQLLYDIEVGMPYLFVDQLTVQAPQTAAGNDAGRLRVLVSVSGQWQGAK
jgi:general secretion pathway protein M